LMKPKPHAPSACPPLSISERGTTAWSVSSDADEAESLWRMALRGTLPISVKDATRGRVRRAAELKSKHAIAYADTFAVAMALECNATLLTGDPEIEPLEGEQNLKVEWLPRKS
jgi:hypothetical protein